MGYIIIQLDNSNESGGYPSPAIYSLMFEHLL